MMAKRIAQFHKVSYEQFAEGFQDTFGEMKEGELKEIYQSIKLPKRATAGCVLRLSGSQRHLHGPLRLRQLYGRAGVHELARGLHEELPGGSPLHAAVPQPEGGHLLRSGRLGAAGHHMVPQAHLRGQEHPHLGGPVGPRCQPRLELVV